MYPGSAVPNPKGVNGYDNGTSLSPIQVNPSPASSHLHTELTDELLKKALLGYAKMNKSIEDQLRLLDEEYGYRIRKRKLCKLRKEFNIPSTRRLSKTLTAEQQVQIIVDATAEDRLGLHGTDRVRNRLIRAGTPLPRASIRRVRRLLDPEGPARRFPGSKVITHRGTLQSDGPLRELSADGHEKLNSQALQMGPVSLNIYGMRDKWTGAVLLCRVVPNDRCQVTIAHLFLDFVEAYRAIPVQLTTDKGTETGIMRNFQFRLRSAYAPDLTDDVYPACVALKSTQNITIEAWWKHLGQIATKNFKQFLLDGQRDPFNADNQLHINLFNWLWPEVLQSFLDETVKDWNTHIVRYQPEKAMPSGVSPAELWARPEDHDKIRCGIAIEDAEEIAAELRHELPHTREEVFRWVTDEFHDAAEAAYDILGRPEKTMVGGWDLFRDMLPLLQDYEFED